MAKKQFKDDGDQQNKFVDDVLKRLNGSSDLTGVVKETDLVIEAIVENMGIKHKLFQSIDKVNPPSRTLFSFPFEQKVLIESIMTLSPSPHQHQHHRHHIIGCAESHHFHIEHIIIVDYGNCGGDQS